MRLLLKLLAFIVLIECASCLDCFHCEWQKELPNEDPRCGWGADFTVPNNSTDKSVRQNCQKCAISYTKRAGEIFEAIRMCVTGFEHWQLPADKCTVEPLYGGTRHFCYCDSDFCNVNDTLIDNECAPPRVSKPPVETTMTEHDCYECQWKSGESGPPYNDKCGLGGDFDPSQAPTSSGCGTCAVHVVRNDTGVVEVQRVCYGPLTGKNYWANYVPSCITQTNQVASNKFCYCKGEKCNAEQDSSLPDSCTNPTIPPTDPPLPKYSCYSCNWNLEVPSDERCRYGDDFNVPNNTADGSVLHNCLKCGLSISYRGSDMYEIVRLCLGEAELGEDRELYPNNTCSSEPLEGGKREICFCEGSFCNKEKENLPDVCDGHPTQSPPRAVAVSQPKSTNKCFVCSWKKDGSGDSRCKLGNDFTVPNGEAKENCGTCYLGYVKKGDEVVEVQRACFGDASGINSWQNHETACAKQPLKNGEEDHCYCNSDFCNKQSDNIQSACVPIPSEPVQTYNCYQCSWSFYPNGLNDDRCGWGSGFNVPQNPNDPAVGKDCLKCGLAVTYKGGDPFEITRLCVGDMGEEWEHISNYCVHDVLKGGKNEFCFCEGEYCNVDNSNITNFCDRPRSEPEPPTVTVQNTQKDNISCYECFWKRGANQGPYDANCGLGNDFNIPPGQAKKECGMCELSITYRGVTVMEIHRTCLRDLSSDNDWREHLPGCSTQPTAGGRNQFCYCDTDLCNEKTAGIENMCDVAVPTLPPAPTYSCFQCAWNDNPDGLIDPRCGYGSGFSIANNTADRAVMNNCFRCAIAITFKGNTPVDIFRACVQDQPQDWERYENKCVFDPLKGGKNQYCFCEGDFCNHDDKYIPSVCDAPLIAPERSLAVSRAANIKCYECFWKRGNPNSPYNPKCGYGPEFNISKSEAKENCGMCHVAAVIRGGFIEEVQRTCLSDLTGSNEWKEHIPSCTDQPLSGATNRFCYCDTDYCNEMPTNLPDSCDVTIPTIPPKKSYNCYHCSWSDNPDGLHDSRCGWGDDFDVPQNVNDGSVGKNCLKCGLQLVYKGSQVVDLLRVCVTDFGEDWQAYDNVCSHDILRGGKNEFCFCEGDYCNTNNDNITSVCDSPQNVNSRSVETVEVETQANVKCFECFWKRGETQAPYDPKCGYGQDFDIPDSSAKDNCGVCHLEIIRRDGAIEQVSRTCVREITGNNAWRNHEPACAIQPMAEGEVQICHCSGNLCNKVTTGIPNACDVAVPTSVPVVRVNCFQCSWSRDGNGLHDARCGWGSEFIVGENPNDPAVRKDCIKCGMLITFKGNEPETIQRSCLADTSENWANLDTKCSYDILKGGRNEFCFCDSNYCNKKDNSDIPQFCDTRPFNEPEISFNYRDIAPKAGVKCYECFWKRGNAQAPYDPKCGFGSDFTHDNENVKDNCGICEMTVTYEGDLVESIVRTCKTDLTGANEWREHVNGCSEQPVISGKNLRSCHCVTDLCNKDAAGVPDTCSLAIPTTAPEPTGVTCYHCSWARDGPGTTDTRCGYGAAFSVPAETSDRSVVQNCQQCAHLVTYKYNEPERVDRICIQGLEDWEIFDNKCVYDPLIGGRHEYCYCKGAFCNRKEDDIPNVCNTVYSPKQAPFAALRTLLQPKATYSCFECFWKKGQSNAPFDTRCGWDSFSVPDSEAKSGCDNCHLNVIYRNGGVEQIYRTCVKNPSGLIAWMAHVPACSELDLAEGKEVYCHCHGDRCNRNSNNIPSACSIPEVPSTPKPTSAELTTKGKAAGLKVSLSIISVMMLISYFI